MSFYWRKYIRKILISTFVVLFLVIYAFQSSYCTDFSMYNSMNSINGGIAVQNGQWIFYKNQADKGSLYRIDISGKNKKKLADGNVYWINVVNNKIYYVNKVQSDSDFFYVICSVDINGNGKKVIDHSYPFERSTSNFNYFNGYFMFYDTDGGLLATSQKENFWIDEAEDFVISGGWIYYLCFEYDENQNQNKNILKKVKINPKGNDGRTIKKGSIIICNDSVSSFNVYDGWVYYSNASDKDKLYKIQTDGKNKKKLTDNTATSINVDLNDVYYSNKSDGGKLYKVSKNGTNNKKISSIKSKDINIAGDWVYCIEQNSSSKIYRVKKDGSAWGYVN